MTSSVATTIFACSFALLLALIAGMFPVADADHYTCTWIWAPGNPTTYNFSKFCDAPITVFRKTKGIYWCNNTKLQVADFDYLGPGTLEFGTACSRKGYSPDCSKAYWAVCISDTDCRVMNKKDDCEWPVKFNISTAPKSVSIYSV